jgi:acyl-CoA oxidase
MRDEASGELLQGVSLVDMGKKTVANDLDNARIRFHDVFVPRESLLSRFVDVNPAGEYVQLGDEPMRIEVIGQRLLTGRLAIAEAALVAVRQLFLKTKAYADEKLVNAVSGSMSLSQLPQMEKLFREADEELTAIETFTASVEARLSWELRRGTIPDADLVEAISVCKIRNIELATAMEHRLEQEVGSYALMAESGFIYKDMLLCCKFAEGDSRILMQKMVRDELKRAQKKGFLSLLRDVVFQQDPVQRSKAYKTINLARALRAAPNMASGFEKEWASVYALADNMCDAHVHERPKGEEVARILRDHPDLMIKLQQPLLVSRL